MGTEKTIYLKGHISKSEDSLYDFIASTSAVDRQGDVVDQNGWELDSFLKNPVLLWAHKYDELPIGKVVEISKESSSLRVRVEFASKEENPKAEQVKLLVDRGILNALSVGFIAKERNGSIITRSELLEISVVPVPANQEALRLAYKSMDLSLVKGDIDPQQDDAAAEPEAVQPEEGAGGAPEEEPEQQEEQKAGRAISAKTRKTLESALASLKGSISEIEGLLALSGVSGTDEGSESASKYVVISRDDLVKLKEQAKFNDKTSEHLLSSLSKLGI